MARYLVTYDLVGTSETSQDYKRLIEAIQTYPDWGKIQKSVFLIKSGRTSSEIFDHLWAFMDGNDRLFVIEIPSNNATWINVICANEWIQNFFRSA